ncbi:MAG: MBL fold metallo-hydrolase [Shinella sp.]|nr:MBL fold metallo-hydrolase [Shinella sp.]
MKITDNLHLVASGATGFGLTHALDCNVFLFTDGQTHHVFDAGAGLDIDAIFAAMRFGELDPAGLRTLFLTHGHADHSGGAAGLKGHIPELTVVTGTRTAEILAQKDERLISLDRARGSFYPLDYVWHAPEVDCVLADGESLNVGPFRVTIHDTPGHSDDHCCYTVAYGGNVSLVAGDAIFVGGKIFLQDIEDCSVPKTLASIRKLDTLAFDIFLPGHGAFSLQNGKRHVRSAMTYADVGALPPQF